MKFIDEANILIHSGHGGPGAVSFRRESMTPRGGPDGGNGGRGGDVIVRVNPQLGTLLDFKFTRKFFAKDGNPGEADNCSGSAGEDAVLMVPQGTLVKSMEGAVIADLNEANSEVVLAR